MHIYVSDSWPTAETTPSLTLVHSNWNDYWEFETQYVLYYHPTQYEQRLIGVVKIATHALDNKRPDLPSIIPSQPFGAFSVGQDADYYANLRELGPQVAEDVFLRLGDIAFDADLRREVLHLRVTEVSLLRSVPAGILESQFWRTAHGGARLTDYNFTFNRPESATRGAVSITFKVTPESRPPTNIHVLVGRNGAGKSTLLADILAAFQYRQELTEDVTSLVAVSFSAFDAFGGIWKANEQGARRVHSIGLNKDLVDPWDAPNELKSKAELGEELKKSLLECWSEPRRTRLIRAMEVLENDPIFAESGFSSLLRNTNTEIDDFAGKYWKLSSGHRIVLLTMTRLVEAVEEKSLVLIDEPEAHLHPPLLSAYIRALSNLLIDRNGLAIVATHSPVVLQEVPRTCVSKIARSGNVSQVASPEIETFGENVGTLTHEVFGLEVSGTGFHRMLLDIALDSYNYEEAVAKLGGQLGHEGRAILRALLATSRADLGS